MQRSLGSHVQIHPYLFTSPGQPVADLENYLQALEKKQQYVQKLLQKLDAKKSDDACSKSLASSESRLDRTIHHYIATHDLWFPYLIWNWSLEPLPTQVDQLP